MKYAKNKGSTAIIAIFIVAIVLIIIALIGAIYFGIMNSIIYNLKLDMYSINKSAIVSVNKGITSRSGKLSYDISDYRNYFEEQLRKNYNLDEHLKNQNGLVQEVEILEYKILDSGKRDSVTNKKSDGTTIHSLIKVKVKPLLMVEQLKDTYIFEIHEDVAFNLVKI